MKSLIFTNVMKEKFAYSKFSPFSVSCKESFIAQKYKLEDGTVINIYENNTLTISGKSEDQLYNYFIDLAQEENLVGMDEVGVGDFFGPVVYVAVHLNQKTINKIKELKLKISDSKRIGDEEVYSICKKLAGFIDYKYQVVYDYQVPKNLNQVSQKVYFHHKNVFSSQATALDAFTTEKSFMKYSQELKLTWPSKLYFETKADSKFLAVALASIIARGIFLAEMKKLQVRYPKVKLDFGANVKTRAQEFVDVYGKKELAKFCKTSFKTFDELMESK